jgi:hypothetical protein
MLPTLFSPGSDSAIVRAAAVSRLDPCLLAGVLALGLLLGAAGLDWGLPSAGRATWSYDEIPPSDSGRTARTRHGGRYPPLHYDVLRALYAPVRWANTAGWIDLEPRAETLALQRLGRSLSLLMGVATVYGVYRVSRLLFGARRPAILAALVAALPVPFVRFSKTVNLDVPYTFWFVLSLFFLLRVLRGHRWRDYLAFGLATAFAIGTKDQAAGLYLAVPLLVVVSLAAEARHAGWRRPLLRATFDPRPLASAALALVVFALIHRLHLGTDDFREHLGSMFGKGSSGRADYSADLFGQVAMGIDSLRQIAFSLGGPMAAAAIAGIAIAARERRWPMLSLLALPVGYYLAFLVPIRHVRVRWWIPVVVLLAPFATLALTRLLGWRRLPRVARAGAAGGAIIYSLALAVCLDLQMLGDSRHRVEAWLAERVAAGESWRAIATYSQVTVRGAPPLTWDRLRRNWPAGLARLDADYLVVNRDDALRTGAADLLADLDDGTAGYVEAFRHRVDPCCGRPDWSGIATVLHTVNPELTVYRRLGERAGEPRGGR